MAQDNKLKSIMLTIKEIDKDHNGFVTLTELDDIIKLYYRQELMNKDLIPFINKFSSLQNRILIHYKSFQSYVKKNVAKIEQEMQEKKKKAELKQKGQELVEEKIKELQGKVDKISDNEKVLKKKLSEYEEYQKSKASRSMGMRAQSCSGQRSTRSQQMKQSRQVERYQEDDQHSRTNSIASNKRPQTSNMYSQGSKRHSRVQSKEDQHANGKHQAVGPYAEQVYASKRNASVLQVHPGNNETSPRIDNFYINQKHNTSVGAAKREKEGLRVFNVAEYFKNKGTGQMDFTEVSSELKTLNKKNSASNIKDLKEDRRLLQANLMSMQNQNANGKRRRNIQNILA